MDTGRIREILKEVLIFPFVILAGTFALAFAFAGNDLVNFVGVPLAALEAMNIFEASGAVDPKTFMMGDLAKPSTAGSFWLILSGLVMVGTLWVSKKARRVSATEVLAGRSCWNERIGSEEMLISAPSFFQVNTQAAEILIDIVMEALDPKPHEMAMDLYCGAGTFTLPLARRCDYVSAVESYGPAVRDLRRNLERAQLDNVDVIGGDAVREFPDADADVLVVDPPRAGLAPEAVDLIAETSARDVAYVSCDPATLARDLKRFREQNVFEPVRITPVDLFPQTFHCETVVHLTRRA